MKINTTTYYIPYLIFFIVLLFFHQGIVTHTNDDIGFTSGFKTLFSLNFHQGIVTNDDIEFAFANGIKNLSILNEENFVFSMYFHWSSRVVTNFFIPIFCILPDLVWKFFDSLLLVIVSILMPRIIFNYKFIKENEAKYIYIYNLISIFLFLLFYLIYYSSPIQDPAGYITTSINYNWPFYFAVIHFYLLKKYLINNKNKLNNLKKYFIYFLTFFSLIFAINQEMMIIIVGGMYFFILGYFIYKKEKLPKSMFLILFVIILVLLMEYLSPGNKTRNFVIYGTYNFGLPIFRSPDLSSFFNDIIKIPDLISYLFFGLVGIYSYINLKNKKLFILGFIPVIILTVSYFRSYIPLITSLINEYHLYIMILFSFTSIYNIMLIFYYKKRLISLLILWLFMLGYISQYLAYAPSFGYRTIMSYYTVILFLIELLIYGILFRDSNFEKLTFLNLI